MNGVDILPNLIELCFGKLLVHNRAALSELAEYIGSSVGLVIVLHNVRPQLALYNAKQADIVDKCYVDVRNRVERGCRRIRFLPMKLPPQESVTFK